MYQQGHVETQEDKGTPEVIDVEMPVEPNNLRHLRRLRQPPARLAYGNFGQQLIIGELYQLCFRPTINVHVPTSTVHELTTFCMYVCIPEVSWMV